MKTIAIYDLTFKRPDDGECMRLLRAFLRCSRDTADAVLAKDAIGRLSEHLMMTPQQTAYIGMIRRELGPKHPECKPRPPHHYLMMRMYQEPLLFVRAVELLIGIPSGTLGG